MDPHMTEIGKMTYNMAMVWNIGTITLSMTEPITKETNMAKEATHGPMVPIMTDSGFKTELKEMVDILGKTEEFTKDNGWTITWKVMESTHGPTAENMKDNIIKTKNTEKVNTHGLTDDATMVNG
jgi:hypothetical protein